MKQKYSSSYFMEIIKKSQSGVKHTKYVLVYPKFDEVLNRDGRRAEARNKRLSFSINRKAMLRDLAYKRMVDKTIARDKKDDANRAKSAIRRANKKNDKH